MQRVVSCLCEHNASSLPPRPHRRAMEYPRALHSRTDLPRRWSRATRKTGAPFSIAFCGCYGQALLGLPKRYPSYQTCHRRFQQWVRDGILKSVLEVLAEAPHDEGYLDLQEAFIDGSFAPAKHGGARVGKTKRGKGSKIMAVADRNGLPFAVYVESATPHEVTL